MTDLKPIKLNTRCWNCGKENNRQVSSDGSQEMPENGNVSMCFYCGNFAIFDDTMPDRVRKPSPSENDEIYGDKEMQRMLLWWRYNTQNRKQD